MKKKLLIATHNQSKFEQMREVLAQGLPDYEFLSLDDCDVLFEVDETGVTVEENALLKAQAYAEQTGLPTISDDTGLMIDALDGAPGVYSSRYAGLNASDMEKVDYLLEKMKHVPEGKRQAHFSCAVAFVNPQNGLKKLFTSEAHGYILTEKRGKLKIGFPYYLVFVLNEYGKTMGEMLDEGIPYVAHRQKALQMFIDMADELVYE
jgi:XTP/dITP diphosphohydrolase